MSALLVLSTAPAAGQAPAAIPNQHDYPSADRAVWTAEHDALLRKAATERRADRPDVGEVIKFLGSRERSVEAISLAREAVRVQPAKTAEIVSALNSVTYRPSFRDPTSGAREALQDLVTQMRARLQALPREEAAHAARALLNLDAVLETRSTAEGRAARLRAFMEEYAGTAEATLAEVDLVGTGMNPDDRIAALEAYAHDHPRSAVGAKALSFLASALEHGPSNEPRNTDPTPRFMKVVGIVDALESGQYPPGQSRDTAASHVIGFFAYQPQYSPENLDRVIDAYTRFLQKHFVVDESAPLGNSAGYVLTSKMAELFKIKGDPAGVDRTFAELERTAADPDAVRFLRAVYDFSGLKGQAVESDKAALIARSNRALTDLAARASGLWAQRALATLATQQFAQRDFAAAIATYRRYLAAYPKSDWAWVAAVRVGQSQAELGDRAAARTTLRAVASSYTSRRVAQIVALGLAARASAALGDFSAEQADLQRAVEAWDPDFGPTLPFSQVRLDGARPVPDLEQAFRRDDIAARSAALASSLARNGGATIEAGRWRLQQSDWNGAITTLEPLSRTGASPVANEARVLIHRARLERAMAMADMSSATRDEAGADRELKALATDPIDYNVAAASMARAALGWRQGLQGDARLWMREWLEAWRTNQPLAAAPATGTLAEDVLAIRDVVFRPLGGGLYQPRWNGFEFPTALPRYLLARSSLQVKFPGGRMQSVAVNRPPSGLTNVLFFDEEQEAFLKTLMARLGGTATRQPNSPMETPNQPVGPSMNILSLFNEFFPARPGHWGGWEFFAYPVISSIEFRDEARTKAAAAVTIGYAGCTVILEKRDGVWVATQITNTWVT